MAYTKTTWINGETPAINADNLNKIETGLDDIHNKGKIHQYTEVNAATYTPTEDDYRVGVKYTPTGAVTITLATAMVTAGRCIYIIDEGGNAGTNNITITTEGGELIKGNETNTISDNYGRRQLYSDGTDWYIC